MFISKDQLRKLSDKAYEVATHRYQISEMEKSLRAMEEFLGVHKIRIPQMQNVTPEVTKYEKKCEKCKCAPSNPVLHQEAIPCGPAPSYSYSVFNQCGCICHTKKK